TGGNLGPVPEPLAADLCCREDPLDQVRRPPPAPGRPGSGAPSLLAPGGQALRAHQASDGVLAHPPASLAQVGGDPRRPVLALMPHEQPLHFCGQPLAVLSLGRQPPTGPLVTPGAGHPQRPARHRGRDAVPRPLGSNETGHHYRPIASFTQRATERLSTSRSIASPAFSRRSRASSARSSSSSTPLPSPRPRRSALTQFPRVPALIPRSRATSAIGLPVSRTSRTAPSRKSRSNFLRVSPIALPPLRRCVHATRGSPPRAARWRSSSRRPSLNRRRASCTPA